MIYDIRYRILVFIKHNYNSEGSKYEPGSILPLNRI